VQSQFEQLTKKNKLMKALFTDTAKFALYIKGIELGILEKRAVDLQTEDARRKCNTLLSESAIPCVGSAIPCSRSCAVRLSTSPNSRMAS
jgi:hypothetical protein